jgi:SAM-dependent methyltransferase
MWQDVSYLRQFYATPLGHIARRLIRRRLRELWPETTGLRVLAIGYGTPYMRPFQESAERAVAVMPDLQGVTHWPAGGPGLVALSEEDALPFPDNAFDRVLLVHAVESSEQLRRMLRDIWRVLAGEGRIVAVVPNRRGLWSRLEGTPFGHGQPYSQRQLERLLRENLFVPVRSDYALYMPPSQRRFLLGLAPTLERIGGRWLHPFGGVVIVEAEKQVYSGIPVKGSRVAARRHATAGSSSADRAGLSRETD